MNTLIEFAMFVMNGIASNACTTRWLRQLTTRRSVHVRRRAWICRRSGIALLWLVMLAGCGPSEECAGLDTCEPTPTTSTSSSSAGTTSSDGPPIECIPQYMSVPIDDSCGVFVSSSKGSDDNEGTKEKPFKSLSKAVMISGGKPIYMCTEVFTEAVTLSADATFIGGPDCSTDWRWAGLDVKTVWTAPPDEVPLTVGHLVEAKLGYLSVAAASATKAGGSSTAVVSDGYLTAEYVHFTSGDGAKGATPEAPEGDPTLDGEAGSPGANACSPGATHPGALGPMMTCSSGAFSWGGSGGDGGGFDSMGNPLFAGSGSAGWPFYAMFSDFGQGGTGEGAGAPACKDGLGGAFGSNGEPGEGATGLGVLTAQGYLGADGQNGGFGKPGQGGGGGGGSKGAKAVVGCGGTPLDVIGASGGSGGTGGCGGKGGSGGGAGGSSITIVKLGGVLTFKAVQIESGKGGDGGAGGNGQVGGQPGIGGAFAVGAGTAKKSCRGGDGGQGGVGGKGGGGRGGHSIGIAYTYNEPFVDEAWILIGAPGNGGLGDGEMGNGIAGVAAKTQTF